MKFVIIGAGELGSSLASHLMLQRHSVVLIERDREKIDRELGLLEVRVVHGNGCSPEILLSAGIDEADYVIAASDSDETNLLACFLTRLISPKPKRIARVRDLNLRHPALPQELISEYVDLIINPDQAAAEHLIQLLKIPGAREVLEFADGKVRVLALSVAAHAPLTSLKLNALRKLPHEPPVLFVAVMRGSKLIVPKGDDRIKAGDVVYAVTVPEKLKLLFELVGKEYHDSKTIMIWGESGLGMTLAHNLEANGASVKFIVSDADAAEQMASELSSSLVLHGLGTDQNLLMEEHIDETDAFIAATEDEESNILAALLAKKLGVKTAMAAVNKKSYLPIVPAIGVDVVISPRLAAAQAISHYVHSRSGIAGSALQHEGGGFLEIVAEQNSAFLGTPIRDLKLPHGILVVAIVREEHVIIPGGDSVIEFGDRVVLFLLKTSLKKLEKILGIELELFA